MRKSILLIPILLGIVFYVLMPKDAEARICAKDPVTGKYSTDLWANGGHVVNGSCPSAFQTEIAQDSLGNLEPTITGTVGLGTSSLQWDNLYSISETISGNGSINGNISVGGLLELTPVTTTYIESLNAPAGSLALVEERDAGALVSNAFNECVSTQTTVGMTATFVYLSVSTNSAGGQAVAGGACNK